MNPACSACSTSLAPRGINLGYLPVSHDLLLEPSVDPHSHRRIPFHLVQCPRCALVQTFEAPSANDLIPRANWVSFTEPSLHLEDFAQAVLSILPPTKTSMIGGISSKDDSLLKILAASSQASTWRIDPTVDTGFTGNSAGVSWLQETFDQSLANRLRAKHGKSDILVARHFLEHVPHIPRIVQEMISLLKPGGHLVLEVPDCEQGLLVGDDSILWEEHHLCFTAATLTRSLRLAGLKILWSKSYQFPNETCLAVIATPASPTALTDTPPSPAEFDSFSTFAAGFPDRCRTIRHLLVTWRKHGAIAIYGAGHHTNTFLHAHKITDLIDFVVDDNTHKTGKFIPGTGIRVLNSDSLRHPEVSLCLSSLGFSAEQRVVSASTAFTNAGGAFYSIFPENNRSPFRWLAGSTLTPP